MVLRMNKLYSVSNEEHRNILCLMNKLLLPQKWRKHFKTSLQIISYSNNVLEILSNNLPLSKIDVIAFYTNVGNEMTEVKIR